MTHLENLAASEEGVRSAHAVQAGREIRVLVDPDRVAEGRLLALAQRLARRIEEQSDTMGEVRCTWYEGAHQRNGDVGSLGAMLGLEEQVAELSRGCVSLHSEEELLKRLERSRDRTTAPGQGGV